MQVFVMIVLTLLILLAAGFAHARIAVHSSSRVTSAFNHAILLLLGTAFAWTMHSLYRQPTDLLNWLVVLSAFGVVHVPAAAILFLKDRQGSG